MQYYLVKDKSLTDIADAIREKTGKTHGYSPEGMIDGIGAIIPAGQEFRIAYGLNAPEDTTKLWVKTGGPRKVHAKTELEEGYRHIQTVGTIPTAAMSLCAASVGTKVYLFGGTYGSSFQYYLSAIRVFDTQSNTVTTLPTSLPTGARNMRAVAVGTKVYLFGGYNNGYHNTIYEFDAQTNTLSTLSVKLPTAAMSVAAAAVGTKIYLFGGRYGDQNERGDWLDTIHVFDTETKLITTLDAVLPVYQSEVKAAAVGTKVYLFATSSDVLQTIYVFDTGSNTISAMGLSYERPDNAVMVGGNIYLTGYWTNNVTMFNPETETVSVLDVTFPVGGYGAGVAAVESKMYRFGGYRGGLKNGIYLVDTVPAVRIPAGNLLVEIGAENAVQLLPNMEIGVANVYLGNADGYGEKVPAAVHKNGIWEEV